MEPDRYRGRSRLHSERGTISFDAAAANVGREPAEPLPPAEDDSVRVLAELMGQLEVDRRGTAARDEHGRRAKGAAFAALGLAGARDGDRRTGRSLAAAVAADLRHLLPPASQPHARVAARLVKELGSRRGSKTEWFFGESRYAKLVRDFVQCSLSRRELVELSRLAVPIVAGIHLWPKSTPCVRVRVGVTISLRREWTRYFTRVAELVTGVARALGREVSFSVVERHFTAARQEFFDPATPYDIVMLDEPWLEEFANSAVYDEAVSGPLPIVSNSTVLIANRGAERQLADSFGLRPDRPVGPDGFTRLAAAAARTPRLRAALSANTPHALANLLLQVDACRGATEPDSCASLRGMTPHLRDLSVARLEAIDAVAAVEMVARGDAAWTIGWLSHLGLAHAAAGGGPVLRRLQLYPLCRGFDGANYIAVRADARFPQITRLLARAIVSAVDPGILMNAGHLPSVPHLAGAPRVSVWGGAWSREAILGILRSATPRYPRPGFARFADQLWAG